MPDLDVPASRAKALQTLIDAVLTREGQTPAPAVVISGPQGSGKSALLDQFVQVSSDKGATVVVARPPLDRPPTPYALALDVATEAATVMPRLATLRDGMNALIRANPAQIDHAATACLVTVFDALQQPAVLAVEDLPGVDAASIALLVRLRRQRTGGPVTIVATHSRPGPPLGAPATSLLDVLGQDGNVVDVTLAPLAADEVAAVAAGILGAALDEAAVVALRDASAGNLFLVEQAILGWIEAGLLRSADDRWRLAAGDVILPEHRRYRVIDRLVGLDPRVRTVASAASLLRAVHISRLALLETMTSLPAGTVAEAVDQLVEYGSLVPKGAEGEYVFAEPLLRDSLRHGLGPAERWRRMHDAVDWLNARPRSPEVLLELADLLTEVADAAEEGAIGTLVRAADLVHDVEPRDAIRWYGAALSLLPHDHLDRPLILSRLSRALFVAGQLNGSLEAGRAALPHLPPGDDERRSRRLVAEAIIADAMESVSDEGIEYLRAVSGESPDDIRLQAATAHLLARAGRIAEAEDAMSPLRHLPDTADIDDRIIARVHVARANSLLARDEDMARDVEETLGVLGSASFQAQLVALSYFSYILAEHGALQAGELIERAAAVQERSHWDLWHAELELARLLDDFRAGRWDAALERATTISLRFSASGSYSRLAIARAIEVEILANRGEWQAARKVDCAGLPSPAFGELRAWALAGVDLLSGDHNAVDTRLRESLERAGMPRWRQLLLARLAQCHLEAGALDAAVQASGEFVGLSPLRFVSLGALDGWRAHGAATGAVDLLRELRDEAERREAPLLHGTVLLDLALQGDDPEPRLRQAYELFHGLGADPWRRRVTTHLRSLGLKVPRHRKPAAIELTDAELQVARLVQQGSRNRDIAGTLCMSVKTVESYLTRIYAKTGVSSRLELARRLDEVSHGARAPVAPR